MWYVVDVAAWAAAVCKGNEWICITNLHTTTTVSKLWHLPWYSILLTSMAQFYRWWPASNARECEWRSLHAMVVLMLQAPRNGARVISMDSGGRWWWKHVLIVLYLSLIRGTLLVTMCHTTAVWENKKSKQKQRGAQHELQQLLCTQELRHLPLPTNLEANGKSNLPLQVWSYWEKSLCTCPPQQGMCSKKTGSTTISITFLKVIDCTTMEKTW